jgi:hypothetical protein
MTPSLWEQEELDFEQPSVSPSKDLRLLAYRSSSLLDLTRLQLREESMLRLEICTKTIGDGISTILLRVQIGLEIKTQFII